MGELIERQAAIDAIVQCTNCGDEDTLRGYVLKHNLDNGWTGGILEALDAVKDLPPAQPEPQWIPVKREVPEMPGYYITSSEYGGVTVDFYYNHFWNAQKNAYKVLAWMPLPKIYKPNK